MPLDMISRPARLAEQLGRHDAPSGYADRAGTTAASVAYAGRSTSVAAAVTPGRIGDLYRRPAVTREARRG